MTESFPEALHPSLQRDIQDYYATTGLELTLKTLFECLDPLLLDTNFLIQSFKEDLLMLPSTRDVKCPEKNLLIVWWARKEFQISTLAGMVDTNFGGLTYKHLLAKLPEHVDSEMFKFGLEIGLGKTPTVGQWPLVLSRLDYICEFYRTQVSWNNVTFNSLKKTFPRIEKGVHYPYPGSRSMPFPRVPEVSLHALFVEKLTSGSFVNQ